MDVDDLLIIWWSQIYFKSSDVMLNADIYMSVNVTSECVFVKILNPLTVGAAYCGVFIFY